jgi:hypothetical protein
MGRSGFSGSTPNTLRTWRDTNFVALPAEPAAVRTNFGPPGGLGVTESLASHPPGN